jgi:hypothetical protein
MTSTAPRRRHPVLRAVGYVGGSLLVVGGLLLGAAALLWPSQVEQAYGEVQITVGQWRTQQVGEVPIAHLGATGGKGLVDRCDGTFTEMESYERDGLPPVWAAHNNCGGDVVLPLAIGDLVDLEHDGATVRYRVIDVRETSKVWVTTEAIIGLHGELALQSCFYGGSGVPMKFLGLVRAEAGDD